MATKKFKFYTIRKHEGDDMYSWAVFNKKSAIPVMTGLGKSEAVYYRDKFEKQAQEKADGCK